MADVLLFLFAATRVAVVATDDAYGGALLQAFRAEAGLQGIEIATEQTFAAGAAPPAVLFDMLRRTAARYHLLLCSAHDGAQARATRRTAPRRVLRRGCSSPPTQPAALLMLRGRVLTPLWNPGDEASVRPRARRRRPGVVRI